MRCFPNRHMLSFLLATAVLAAGALTTALAQDGAYIVEPWSGSYSAVKIQPGDQKIVAAGTMNIANPDATTENRMAISRYTSLGTPDLSYGIGGPSILPLSGLSAPMLGSTRVYGHDLVLQPDGKALVSGPVQGPTLYEKTHVVARFTASGTLDGSFGGGGWASLDARSDDYYSLTAGVSLQSTGKVVVALSSMGSSTDPGIVGRLKANGVLDGGSKGFGPSKKGYTLTTFGTADVFYHKLAVQADDKLVAVGSTLFPGQGWRLLVARFTASGVLDSKFNGCGYHILLPAGLSDTRGQDVARQSDGKIVVAGFCTGIDGADDMLVARYKTNGRLDTSFGGGTGYVRLDIDGTASMTSEMADAVAIQPDGKIVSAGTLIVSGNPNSILVVRLNANGTPDATFGGSGFKLGTPPAGPDYHSFWGGAVALQADGGIIVAGRDDWDSSEASDALHPLLMRFIP